MREILFRGKRADNGEWVEGDLDRALFANIDFISYFVKIGERVSFEIISETVGQYTGLTDKNGKKIFEGDILSERPPMNETAYMGYVAYDNDAAVYRFMINNDGKYNGVLLGTYSQSYTVIGNTHDNPELLKDGADNG
jgi:uncharacterized phage protein (TIGR01671 family)